ncbi:MAG: hypothetical protein ACUVV0_08155 [Anaerolineae bacterium]
MGHKPPQSLQWMAQDSSSQEGAGIRPGDAPPGKIPGTKARFSLLLRVFGYQVCLPAAAML